MPAFHSSTLPSFEQFMGGGGAVNMFMGNFGIIYKISSEATFDFRSCGRPDWRASYACVARKKAGLGNDSCVGGMLLPAPKSPLQTWNRRPCILRTPSLACGS
jgi:hypothetical protein